MQETTTSPMLKLMLPSMPEGVDVSIALLKHMGYQTERTEWDFSDLAPKAQQRIRSMYLVSSYQDGFDRFQVFHIELYQSRDEQALKTARLLPILDTFLRRYAQGQYLFIFSAGNSHLVLFHLRKTEWQGNVLLMRFVSRYVDISHLHKIDRWLLESLRLSRQDQTPAQIWAKHRSFFEELRQWRKKLLRKRKLRPRLLEAYYDEIYRYRNPSQAFKDRLIERLNRGDEAARQEIIQAHLWLVVHEAKKYQNRGMDLIDLIQEGNLGLLRAIRDFDPNRGTQFSTYAMWWVRQKIIRALTDKSLFVRIPVHAHDNKLTKLIVIEKKLIQELGFNPGLKAIVLEAGNFTHEERCEAWCCWVNHIPLNYDFEQRFQKIYQKVRSFLNTAQGILSLDETIPESICFNQAVDNAEQRLTLSDLVVEPINLESELSHRLLAEYIQEQLDQIPPREKLILNSRFGLADYEASTLQEVADRVGVTRERIRQIEEQALARLRKPNRQKLILEAYFNASPDRFDDHILPIGSGMGTFEDQNVDGREIELERKFLRMFPRKRFSAEIQHWRQLTYAGLMSEIRQHIHNLPFDNMDVSLKSYIEAYRSPEFISRTNAANSLDRTEVEIDIENDDDFQDEIAEEQEQ